jgi:hypothetical protein
MTEAKQDALAPQDGTIVITSGALGELANAITQSVGAVLHEKVKVEVEKAEQYRTVADAEQYTAAANLRKNLKGLITTVGDPSAPGRLRVRISLGIMDGTGQKIAVAAETTVGTASVNDLYNPLAGLLDKLHKATTSGREALAADIEAARKLLESAILTWDQEQQRKRQEEERRAREKQEQDDRKRRATHWIEQLCEHGYSLETCAALLDHPIDQVTESEVNSLYELLTDVMQKEEKARQEKELKEAIETAQQLGMQSVVDELKGEASKPVVVAAPPPPPPPAAAPVATVAQSATPKVSGMGQTTRYALRIINPNMIPANWLLPPEAKLYDPEAYPRLRAAARSQGTSLKVDGVEVIPESKLTQR